MKRGEHSGGIHLRELPAEGIARFEQFPQRIPSMEIHHADEERDRGRCDDGAVFHPSFIRPSSVFHPSFIRLSSGSHPSGPSEGTNRLPNSSRRRQKQPKKPRGDVVRDRQGCRVGSSGMSCEIIREVVWDRQGCREPVHSCHPVAFPKDNSHKFC